MTYKNAMRLSALLGLLLIPMVVPAFAVGDNPVITITGSNPQTVLLHNPYVEQGATASDTEDGDLTGSIITDSSAVDVDTLGSYIVTYDVTDSDTNTDHQERIVNVVTGDIPVITRLGSDPVTVNLHDPYVDAGATAADTEDGDLTGSIITVNPIDVDTLGTYTVTYDVTDSNGNTAIQVTRTVNVVTGDLPVITVLGNNPETVLLHDSYSDAGATAADTEDGDLTGSIITTGLPVDVDTLGSYTVTYSVTDSNGNMVSEDRTVNVVTGDSPVITILGDNPASLEWGSPYSDAGATASDTEDGDLTGSIVTTDSTIDTTLTGGFHQGLSHTVTYTVTDSNGNTAMAQRTVSIGYKPAQGDYCSGDCIPPTIGVDSSGRRMVDWPVIYETSDLRFSMLADYFHTPMKDFTVRVGDVNKLQFVVYDNSGYDAIRQVGLSIGVPFSGTFNDGAATFRWYAAPPGQTVGDGTDYTEETDPNNIFDLVLFDVARVECSPNTTGNDNCMAVLIEYKFREAPKDTAIRLDIWDEKLNAFQHVLNEGVTVYGKSMNPDPVFNMMGNDGTMYTLTKTGPTIAVDQNDDQWTLTDGFWWKNIIPLEAVVNPGLAEQQSIAKQKWDSERIQKETPAFIPGSMGNFDEPRGHHESSDEMKMSIETAKAYNGRQ